MYLDTLHAIEPKIDIDALWFYLQLIVHFILDKKVKVIYLILIYAHSHIHNIVYYTKHPHTFYCERITMLIYCSNTSKWFNAIIRHLHIF